GDDLALQVTPPCDAAITRFGPATWQMDREELLLKSARGQTWRFEEGDEPNTWRRLPETADPLLLKRQKSVLIPGAQKLERMRDGRVVYIGAERVDDVTAHPAFRQGARTVAGLYDLKADPSQRDLFSFEEDGERISLYWLRCRNREDLARRMRCCKAIADATYGFVGRSPDQVSGLITGLAMNAALLDGLRPGF